MALDANYILSPPIEQIFLDKDTGLPLANGTLTFFRDNARNTGKAVYQLSGTPPNYSFTALTDPVILSAVGTIQNDSGDNVALYFYPFDDEGNIDLYYIVCRDANGVEQFTREAYPANTSIPLLTESNSNENALSNPQFTRVLLNQDVFPTIYDVSSSSSEQTFALAPDWDILITGDGAASRTVTVQRIALLGSASTVTNPPYVLDIQLSSGVNVCRLRQRLNTNSGLWASTIEGTTAQPIYLSASITGLSFGSNAVIKMQYAESSGINSASPVQILNQNLVTTGYVNYIETNPTAIPASTNTDSGANGYVDIFVEIAPLSHVRISSIQVVPVFSPVDVPYDVRSANREQALMGDYYIPRLEAKAISSFLTGWDFPVNPAQFGATGTIPLQAAANYIWDQTIGVDIAGSATYSRNVVGQLNVQTVATNNALYITQYLSGAEAKAIIGNRLSVNVNAYKTATGDNPVTLRVYLFRGNAASVVPTLPATIGTITDVTTGVFVKNNTVNQGLNWAEIPRSGLDTAKAQLNVITTNPEITSTKNNYGFSGWVVTDGAQIADTDKFAIVVTFQYPNPSVSIIIDSISLVPGDIPSIPAPQTTTAALNDCMKYYQKSFLAAFFPASPYVAPGVSTGESIGYNLVAQKNFAQAPGPIVRFATPMIATPAVTLYNPVTNASNQVRNESSPDVGSAKDWTASVATGVSANAFWISGTTNNGSTTPGIGDTLGVHWVADARLGK